MKQKLSMAQIELRKYATAVNKLLPAYAVVFAFAQAEAKGTTGKYDERKAVIVAAFNVALEGLENAADTLRVYLGDAIAVACKPDVSVKVQAEGAKVGEKATETLDVKGIKRYADIRKLASAARESLGVKGKVAGSGKQAATVAAPTADSVKTHVMKMLSVPEGRALIQKWGGECGIWIDFKVQTEASPATEALNARLVAAAAKEETALAQAARAADANAKRKAQKGGKRAKA